MNDSPAQTAANFLGLVAYLFVVGGGWPAALPPTGAEGLDQPTRRSAGLPRQRSAASASRR